MELELISGQFGFNAVRFRRRRGHPARKLFVIWGFDIKPEWLHFPTLRVSENENGFRGVLASVNFINFGVSGCEQLLNFRIFVPFSWITAQDVTKAD